MGLHRFLILASLLVPAGLFTAAAVQNRRDVVREEHDTLVRTAAVMDEHARKVFETGQLALGRVDDRIQGMTWEQISAPETSAFLAKLKASLEQVVSIWVTDKSGTIRAGSQPWNPAVDVREREFFKVQQERDRGPYISGAFRGKATERRSFAISRRRTTPDGSFDGTIHISLSPEYFARTYAAMMPDADHAAWLLRADAEVLVREPDPGPSTPLRPNSAMLEHIKAQPGAGYLVAKSALDGKERAYAYRKVDNYPVYVGVGVPFSVLLERWYANLKLYGAAAGVASLMLLLASWVAVRGIRAERATAARLHLTLEELRRETAQREAAEQRMRQAEKMEAVGKLTGGIAHDFNNLLTAVLGSLQLLRKRLNTADERAIRLLDNAVRGAERGAALTQRLLAFSRAQVLKPEAVRLRELIEGMASLLRSSLGVGIEIVDRVPQDFPPARADANQLELAVLNLALNSRDAMPNGGRLDISGRAERIEAGRDAELNPGDYVVLELSDTGEGMDDATLARAVEPFFTTKGIGKGTGLGLSMVHGLAAQSGGRLILRSRKGEGTVAELWLPRADATREPAPRARASMPAAHRVADAAVLLVDDDALVLASTAPMLEDLGYHVLTASSGAEAMDLFRSGSRIDFVITDQAMPGLTGVQLAAALREVQPGLPVLIATGYAQRHELEASGFVLLDKPFGQAALARAIEKLGLDQADAA
ncbi:MAG: response regulator [Acetobacteraceae bacterium]|nr:response regulator [Acetobacteraceae bacterium]